MKKYGIIGLTIILLISIGMNFYQFGENRQAQAQLRVVNNRVLDNVEQYARWSTRFIDEILVMKETGEVNELMNENAFLHLQNSLEDLVEFYTYFVDLGMEEFGEERVCTKTLESLRSIRNVVNHNLDDKLEMNEFRFTSNDYLFLEELEDALKDFLTNIYRISEDNEGQSIIELSEEVKDDLLGISHKLEELASRYRHSTLMESGEDRLKKEEAKNYLLELAENWVDRESLEEADIEGVLYRNGISHYALETEELLLWMDATKGTLRYLEYTPDSTSPNVEEIDSEEALEIAREFYQGFQDTTYQELEEEIFVYHQEDTGETIFAFRFTPLDNGLRLSSDAFEINVTGRGQKVVRYRNQFDDSSVSMEARSNLAMLEIASAEEELIPLSADNLKEKHQENFPTMEYQGRAVIRNYLTEFHPRLVKVFFEDIEGQRAALYFDEFSGMELERTYYPYEPF